jgi:hypothetical protein
MHIIIYKNMVKKNSIIATISLQHYICFTKTFLVIISMKQS